MCKACESFMAALVYIRLRSLDLWTHIIIHPGWWPNRQNVLHCCRSLNYESTLYYGDVGRPGLSEMVELTQLRISASEAEATIFDSLLSLRDLEYSFPAYTLPVHQIPIPQAAELTRLFVRGRVVRSTLVPYQDVRYILLDVISNGI